MTDTSGSHGPYDDSLGGVFDRVLDGGFDHAGEAADESKDGGGPIDDPFGAAKAELPQTLGDYRIVRELGRGAMGVVYLAEEVSLGRSVALKVLPAHLTLQAKMIERFRVEASSAARLKHPGIVQVYHVDEFEGHHFFAMELVEGSPLDEVIERLDKERFETLNGTGFGRAVAATVVHTSEHGTDAAAGSDDPWRRSYVETVCRIVAQVAEALEHAHRAGVIHRDVKPSNILVRPDGTAVLTDFGLARQEGLPNLTQTGVFAGTPQYMSPEQARPGSAKVDQRSDVFALGSTLYELLTLQHPFHAESIQQVLDRITRHEPQNPRRLNRRLPVDLATITLKALEKDPNHRYQSAADLAADLLAFLRFEPISARPASIASRTVKLVRRHRVACAVGLATTTVAMGAGGWWWTKDVPFRVDSSTQGATIHVDGRPIGVTNQDLRVTPGRHVVRLARPPDRYALERTIEFERGQGQTREIELTNYEKFREYLLSDKPEAKKWLELGEDLPRTFRQRLATELSKLHVDLIDAYAENANSRKDIANRIRRLDRVDQQRAATEKLRSLVAAAREKDRERDDLYKKIQRLVDAKQDFDSKTALRQIRVLEGMRFIDRPYTPAVENARSMKSRLANRLASLINAHVEGERMDEAAQVIALLVEVEPKHDQLPSLRRRLAAKREQHRTSLRIQGLRNEAGRPGTTLERRREIRTELGRLGEEDLRAIDELICRGIFEQWLSESGLIEAVQQEIVSGSAAGLMRHQRRLLDAKKLARPGPGEDPVDAYETLENQLAEAIQLVEECTRLGALANLHEARAGFTKICEVAPSPFDAAGRRRLQALDDLLATRERRAKAIAACDELLDEIESDTGGLRIASARTNLQLLDKRLESAVDLPTVDVKPLRTRAGNLQQKLDRAAQAEAQLHELEAPFAHFLARLEPLPSDVADSARHALEDTLREHRKRLVQAIASSPSEARKVELNLRCARLSAYACDWQRAKQHADAALALHSTTEAHYIAGRCSAETTATGVFDPTAAIGHFDRAVAGEPANQRARFWRAVVLLRGQGNDEKALRDLRAAVDPGDLDIAEVHQRIAEILLDQLPEIRKNLRPRHRDLVVQHANHALAALDEADQALPEGLTGRRAFTDTIKRLRRDVLLLRGMAYRLGKQWRKAISTYTKATEVDPNHARSFLRLAHACTGVLTKQSFMTALDHCKKARELAGADKSVLEAEESLRLDVQRTLRRRW